MLLDNGENWEPSEEMVKKWKESFKGTKVDVDRELVKMDLWCDANPRKRKTPKGIQAFCTRWLNGAEEKGGHSIELQKAQEDEFRARLLRRKSSLRNKTIEEQMTDVTWLDGDVQLMMKQYYLNKVGFYYDGEITYVGQK